MPMSMPMSMPMTMVMTFGSWGDYKLHLIFNSWNIQNRTQYFFTWIFVVLAVVCWHALKHFQSTVIDAQLRSTTVNSKQNSEDRIDYSKVDPNNAADIKTSPRNPLLLDMKMPDIRRKLWTLRLIHAFLSAFTHGLALMLMLVSMTYNCGLFLALLVGHFIGDILFHRWNSTSTPLSEQMDCH